MRCPNCNSENYYAVNVIDAEDEERLFLRDAGLCTDCYCLQVNYVD